MTDRYHLASCAASVADALNRLDAADAAGRLAAGDFTLWADSPEEISDRLAWLTLPSAMAGTAAGDLQRFGRAMRDAGYRHIVLLGMGGSSLGPEVIRQTIGGSLGPGVVRQAVGSDTGGDGGGGYPRMVTLDSTVPAWVAHTAASIDAARTVFVVSSKSGTTTEPLAFYAYFRNLVNEAVGVDAGGDNFVAVTDPGTALAEMGRSEGFRRVFINDPNIGGRYSALSCFGLAPAALIGVDLARLLAPAAAMERRCLASGPAAENPGALLGAAIGALARQGRDKLTLVASPGIAGFGLWAEQLLAESCGKDGKGVIPVAGEPTLPPDAYGDDRFFVRLRLATDDNAQLDAAVARLHEAGHPVAILELNDAYDLGAEFYRWEYATAIAGHILGIHPFDQPDVQGAKDRTVRALEGYQRDGRLPDLASDDAGRLRDLLAASEAGDYLAILAYLPESAELEAALGDLRRQVMGQHRIATTAGYGPRYLHSTGQLHKGGPNSGVFLRLTGAHRADVDIPGWPFTFGALADAQAQGDWQALQDLGRRTVSIRLEGDPAEGVRRIAAAVG